MFVHLSLGGPRFVIIEAAMNNTINISQIVRLVQKLLNGKLIVLCMNNNKKVL